MGGKLLFPEVQTPSERQATIIGSMSAQVPVACGCGSRVPLVMVIIPGMKLVAKCSQCNAQFMIRTIRYDTATDDFPKVEVDVKIPNIILPSK